jgi:acyl-CoA dehydrogenase
MSEARQMLAEAVERLFAAHTPASSGVSADEAGMSADLWREAGKMGLLRPHASGDKSTGWQDAGVILRAAGRHAAPLPIAESIVASWMASRASLVVPEGTLSLAPVPGGVLAKQGAELELVDVPFGRHADFVLVTEAAGTTLRLALLATEGCRISPGETIAGEPRDRLAWPYARPGERAEVALPSDAASTLMAAARTAQMAGALEAILALAVEYAGEREQFGRKIGRFQAVQQELARLAGQVAAAGVAADAAFRALDEHQTDLGCGDGAPGDPTFEVAVAKIIAGEAAEVGPRIAHQVLGAIGFTHEHRLHLFTRRLWAWRAEYGTATEWSRRLGRLARVQAAAGAESGVGLWSLLTAR